MNSKGLGLCCLICDTNLYSESRHDFKSCPCGHIFVDGGTDYLRYGFTPHLYNESIGRLFFQVIDREGKEYYDSCD